MVNINNIKIEFEKLLLNLEPEEINNYYLMLYKKYYNCYPTILNPEFNEEEFNKVEETINYATKVLSRKYYNMDCIKKQANLIEVYERYIKEYQLGYSKFLETRVIFIVTHLKLKVLLMEHILKCIYSYYRLLRNNNSYMIHKELNISYEEIKKLNLNTNYYDSEEGFYYGSSAIFYLNNILELKVTSIKCYISMFNKLFKIDMASINDTKEGNNIPEEVIENIKNLNKFYAEGVEAIKKYNELLNNPFKNIIKNYTKKYYNHLTETSEIKDLYNLEEMLEEELKKAPSYDFKEFKFIPYIEPEGVIN